MESSAVSAWYHAYRHRFLPDVDVDEAVNLARALQLDAAFLEPADEHHLPQQVGVMPSA